MRSQFEKLIQNFELKKVGGAPKDHQLTPLVYTGAKETPHRKNVTIGDSIYKWTANDNHI